MARELYPSITSEDSYRRNVVVGGGEDLRSFVLVRHPFHRLVSAFRDKLERIAGPRNGRYAIKQLLFQSAMCT